MPLSHRRLFLVVTLLASVPVGAHAQGLGSAAWVPQVLGTQVTVISQQLRRFDDGSISRFGQIDTTDGGASQRYSLSGSWHRVGGPTSRRTHRWCGRHPFTPSGAAPGTGLPAVRFPLTRATAAGAATSSLFWYHHGTHTRAFPPFAPRYSSSPMGSASSPSIHARKKRSVEHRSHRPRIEAPAHRVEHMATSSSPVRNADTNGVPHGLGN